MLQNRAMSFFSFLSDRATIHIDPERYNKEAELFILEKSRTHVLGEDEKVNFGTSAVWKRMRGS